MSVFNSVHLFLYRLRRVLAYVFSFLTLIALIRLAFIVGLFTFQVDPDRNVGIALFLGIGGMFMAYVVSRIILNVLLTLNDLWVVVEWETVEDEE